ncbi:hypothetical protein LJ655_28495 [Paraburkholderia sp. MMS20-SJTN17]|uniref:Uncharacterized protein n=1 Tax=Paraburkholderia translucens TaxID=2886945 RepID=A0ABS8KMX0_9BURK|nr:hypothetical protein [Paraburkholderia sp. MMS20-SJTN17]MCC8405749.1 hypothetical protein [Paraburkholderia sp. MMS20-SJTN17]
MQIADHKIAAGLVGGVMLNEIDDGGGVHPPMIMRRMPTRMRGAYRIRTRHRAEKNSNDAKMTLKRHVRGMRYRECTVAMITPAARSRRVAGYCGVRSFPPIAFQLKAARKAAAKDYSL